MSFHGLKKFLGCLKKTLDYCLVVEFSHAGEGNVKKGESYENNQCGLEEGESNGRWKAVIIVIIMIIIMGFAAVAFAMWKLYKYVERRIEENQLHLMSTLGDRVDGAEMKK